MDLGQVIEGKYQLIRVIGEGAVGTVFEGRHLQLDRRVAIKLLRPVFARRPAVVARFLREAQAAATIGSEHIVEVTDVGQTAEGTHYLVMEYLDGEDLGHLVRREGSLEPSRAAELAAQTCRGVGQAHRQNIVHRDLKPENIFLVHRADGREWIKIVDFGVAKFLDAFERHMPQLTKTGSTVGTPFYMAPEQAAGAKEVDRRADIYSLGVILYELLAGRRPYEAKSFQQLLILRATTTPPSLRSLRSEIPSFLEEVVTRAMSSEPEARFTSMDEMESALRLHDTLGESPPVAGDVPSSFPPPLEDLPDTLDESGPVAQPLTSPAPPAARAWAPMVGRGPRSKGGWPAPALVAALVLGGVALVMAVALVVGMVLLRSIGEVDSAARPVVVHPSEVVGESPPVQLPFAPGQVWRGSYLCIQGPTDGEMRIESIDGLQVRAVFAFVYALTTTRGSFYLDGSYDPGARRLVMRPGEWIAQPPGWESAGLDGYVSSSGDLLSGRVSSPSCTTFLLRLQ